MKDIVLVSIRDFQDDKCDIIDLYDDTLVHQLKVETIFLNLLIQEKIMNFVKKLMVELNLLWIVPEEEKVLLIQKILI